MTRILSSDPEFERLRERPDDLPASSEKAEWVSPWTFERLLSTALVRRRLRDLRLRDLRLVRATPRWPTRCISLIVHSHIGVRFLYNPSSFIFVYLFRRENLV